VAALAAELGHDLQGPLNLFRLSLERLTRGDALDEEDLSLLGEELERLGQLNTRLRGLARASASLQRVVCSPRQIVELALGEAPLAGLAVDATDQVTLACDPTLLAHALKELVRNALEARKAQAGVRFERGATPGFCVWDDGAGFELGVDAALAWGATTRPAAAGLGLTVALRAARAHGFNLELRRTPPYTEAWLLVPAAELSQTGSK
jgi:signal transduction histidine kinase